MENKTFDNGHNIIYSTNGLCRIEDIQLMSFISDEEKKVKVAKELYTQGKLSDDMMISLYREFKGIYRPLLWEIFRP